MNCEYSEPVDLDPSIGLQQWHYSKATCQFETMELIENTATGTGFYLDKKIDYGEILIISFLSLFTIAIICKWIAGFIFKD